MDDGDPDAWKNVVLVILGAILLFTLAVCVGTVLSPRQAL